MEKKMTAEEMEVKALASFLECGNEDIVLQGYDNWGLNVYDTPDGEYAIGTDDEANLATKQYIKETAWAFNANFIIEHSNVLDYDDASQDIIKAIQEKCESGNAAMIKLIDDMDEFVDDAIGADGRGHFLSSYDGEENEETISGETFYIYKIG